MRQHTVLRMRAPQPLPPFKAQTSQRAHSHMQLHADLHSGAPCRPPCPPPPPRLHVHVNGHAHACMCVHMCAYACVCESVGYNQTSLPPPPKISNNGHLYRIVITHRGGSQRISNWTVRKLFHIKYGKIGGKRNE